MKVNYKLTILMVCVIRRYLKPDFYTMDLDDDIEVHDMPIMKVSDIRKLDGSYVQVWFS